MNLQTDYEILNPDSEGILPLDINFICDNRNLFSDKHENYLLMIDLFDTEHKFLKRITSLIYNQKKSPD